MKNDQDDVMSKELHKEADDYAKRLVSEFSTKLILQAKILAADDELVLRSHVTKAYRIITNKIKDKWLPELLKIVGGAFLGGGAMSFINEASSPTMRATWLVTYFLLTVIGGTLVFLGFVMELRER